MDNLEIRVPGSKTANLFTVLLGQDRTGDLGDAASALHQPRGAVKHLHLILATLLERARTHPPFCIRIAAPGACSRTRRIDDHEIRRALESRERIVVTRRAN